MTKWPVRHWTKRKRAGHASSILFLTCSNRQGLESNQLFCSSFSFSFLFLVFYNTLWEPSFWLVFFSIGFSLFRSIVQDGLKRRLDKLKKNIEEATVAVEQEREKNVSLLHLIFPPDIAKRLWLGELPSIWLIKFWFVFFSPSLIYSFILFLSLSIRTSRSRSCFFSSASSSLYWWTTRTNVLVSRWRQLVVESRKVLDEGGPTANNFNWFILEWGERKDKEDVQKFGWNNAKLTQSAYTNR